MTVIRWKDKKGNDQEHWYSPHGYSLPPWRQWLSEDEEYIYNKLHRGPDQPHQMDKLK